MTHDSAVKITIKLLPLIEKSGAERVLSEYATTENLPAAQLEKLAQVYNTMSVLSHVDNATAENRGKSIPLVNVPNLVTGYATGLSREKAAKSPSSEGTHDPSFVNLNDAILRELSPPRAVVKAASAPAPTVINFTTEEFNEAVLENLCDARQAMSKLAGMILAEAPRPDSRTRDLGEAEKEALYMTSASLVKLAGDFMEKFAAPHRLRILRLPPGTPLVKRAFAVTPHGLGSKFAELAKAAGTYDFFEKLAAGELSAQEALLMAADGVPTPLEDSADSAPDNLREQEERSGNPRLRERLAAAMAAAAERTPAADGTSSAKPGALPPGATASDDNSRKGGKRGEPNDQSEKEKAKGRWLGKAVAAPFKWTSQGILAAHAKAKGALSTVMSERQNTAQRKTDISVEDIRRSINLRRMIGTDPVLKEADPKAVLDIYNSVTALNPEIAGNMPALRLLLREAVSYEGLTMDSQKTLTDIYKSRTEADSKDAENTKRRYAIGKPLLAPK